jgi:hypothetical protein
MRRIRHLRLFFSVFALSVLTVGCTTSRVIENTRVPEIVIDEYGGISVNGKPTRLGRVTSSVKAAGFTRDQEVNILIPENPDRKLMRAVSGELVAGGYTRTVFVTNRKASAVIPKAAK